jgi:hypothetical protein
VHNEETAVALKRKFRDECAEKSLFVVDVFEEAAKKHSHDETTNFRRSCLKGFATPKPWIGRVLK